MDLKKYWGARRDILACLNRRNKWGGAHTSVRNLTRKISRDKRGTKEVKQAVKDLILEGKILVKKTVEDKHVSLNPRFSKEIKAEINQIILL